jgi:hypothetical protein
VVFRGAFTHGGQPGWPGAGGAPRLDRDQPIGGLAPQTQAELVRQALDEKWDQATFEKALHEQRERHA